MSYELKKPILNDDDRINFIVRYNHALGMQIEDTDKYLFALEPNEIMGEKETDGEVIPYPVINPDYEQEQAQKEQARIQELFMTRSDFFDGTIKAFGADSDDLLTAIQAVLAPMQISDIEKKVAINNYRNALNFYRKHPLFTLLADVPISVAENITITITSEQWDRFFDATDRKDPDAYKYLLPLQERQTEE